MIADYKNKLLETGIVELDLDAFTSSDILDIASSFGIVVPGARGELIQLLLREIKEVDRLGALVTR